MYQFDFQVVLIGAKFVAEGIPITIGVSLAALVIGVVVGMPLGVSRAGHHTGALHIITDAYIEIFRNVPVLVQIVWFYYVLPIFVGVNLNPLTASSIALGLNTSAFLSEIFRGGILGVPSGQYDASASLGFTRSGSMRFVILPQVLRKMLSPLVNQFIVLIKESALVAYIGVLDIMHRGDLVATDYARPLEAYTVVALAYFVICFAASRGARYVEHRYSFPE
jgi:polar amino acid transport system permease protein